MDDTARPLSSRHPDVSHLRRLLGRRRARLDEGLFVVEGLTLLDEARRAGVALRAVYVDAAAAEQPEVAASLALLADTGVPVRRLGPGVLAKVADTVTPQPVVAVAERPIRGIEQLPDLVDRGPVVVLDALGDPGNVGTILRSAEAAGAAAVVTTAGTVDVFAPKTVRASAGSVFRVPVLEDVGRDEVLRVLGELGVRRLGTAVRAGDAYDTCGLTGRVAFVLGNEAHGLSRIAPVGDRSEPGLDGLLTIPMAGATESLNVAMAATLLCFEAFRQRRALGEPIGRPPARTTG